jgi:hypothetical protein
LLACGAAAQADTKLVVTVVNKDTGAPVTDLKAGEFSVTLGDTARPATAAEYKTGLIDVVLMLDSSLIGGQISSLAPSLIGELGEKEQMALVTYDAAADLLQEFTSSKDLLKEALSRVKFGNSPRLLDALYAVAADGFEGSTYRRVILLLTTGVDGPGSSNLDDVVRLCRRNGVSVYPLYMMGYGRSTLERLAMRTGGAAFNARELAKRSQNPSAQVFEVMRGFYELTLPGNLPLGDKAKVDVSRKGKFLVSCLELN